MSGWRWGRAGQGFEVDEGCRPNPARSLFLPRVFKCCLPGCLCPGGKPLKGLLKTVTFDPSKTGVRPLGKGGGRRVKGERMLK